MRQRATLVALIVVVGVIAVVQILRTQSVAQAQAATRAQAPHPVDRTVLPLRETKIDFVDDGARKPVAIAPMALPSHAQHAGAHEVKSTRLTKAAANREPHEY